MGKYLEFCFLFDLFFVYIGLDIFGFKISLRYYMGIYFVIFNNVNVDNVKNLFRLVILKKGYF